MVADGFLVGGCRWGEEAEGRKMEGIGVDAGMEAALRGDWMKKLDDDTALHVLHYLDTTRDIANASGVCRAWRRFGPFLLFVWLFSP